MRQKLKAFQLLCVEKAAQLFEVDQELHWETKWATRLQEFYELAC